MNVMAGAATGSLDDLRREAASCRACPLWKNATQTVFGEGPSDAEIMLVGEQPGDREDLTGHPFVGPAGLILDRALADAGIDRARVYVTNAVKHFKFEPRGKRRLHKRPNAGEIKVCSTRWLFGEIEAITPQLVVALGATAAQSLVGRPVPILSNRGEVLDLPSGLQVLITVHPSALLRLRDEDERRAAYEAFVGDLRSVARIVGLDEAGGRCRLDEIVALLLGVARRLSRGTVRQLTQFCHARECGHPSDGSAAIRQFPALAGNRQAGHRPADWGCRALPAPI